MRATFQAAPWSITPTESTARLFSVRVAPTTFLGSSGNKKAADFFYGDNGIPFVPKAYLVLILAPSSRTSPPRNYIYEPSNPSSSTTSLRTPPQGALSRHLILRLNLNPHLLYLSTIYDSIPRLSDVFFPVMFTLCTLWSIGTGTYNSFDVCYILEFRTGVPSTRRHKAISLLSKPRAQHTQLSTFLSALSD